MGGPLTIDFLGEHHVVEPGDALTFGRAADLLIDESNLYLHRIVGRFLGHDGHWWIENLGSQVELDVESDSGVRVRLPACEPPAAPAIAPLVGAQSAVRFTAGGLRYELVAFHGGMPVPETRAPAAPGRETTQFGRVDLTDDERALLRVLADPVLQDPAGAGPGVLPSNREVALLLGWPLTKFNRKLDYLCVRLARAGVAGLQGGRGSEAMNRRWRLVEHAVAARLVTLEDTHPRPASR
jgi:hypothetical protein